MPKDLRHTSCFRLVDELAERSVRSVTAWQPLVRHSVGAQLARAAVSVPCNLTEATSRASPRERHRFVEIADGSLRETGYLIGLAARLQLLDPPHAAQLVELHARATGLLAAQRSRAKRRAQSGMRRRRRSAP